VDVGSDDMWDDVILVESDKESGHVTDECGRIPTFTQPQINVVEDPTRITVKVFILKDDDVEPGGIILKFLDESVVDLRDFVLREGETHGCPTERCHLDMRDEMGVELNGRLIPAEVM
jgi:hypothetical protein